MPTASTDAQTLAGGVNTMKRLLERRPLLLAERQAQPTTVCVTGERGPV